jgi:uncharacterized protein YbjT (DUF2867 family)
MAGDMDDAASLRKAPSGVSAAFSVQQWTDKGGVEAEERRGKTFADAVKAEKVPFLVYASAEGVERQSGMAHYESNWAVERHIRDLGLSRTILRPVGFMDTFAVNRVVRGVMLGLFRTVLSNNKRVQMVAATESVGSPPVRWRIPSAMPDARYHSPATN